MARVSIQPDIRKLLDLLAQDGLEEHYISLALAGLIYLRWADFQESEQEAIAVFDDTDYQPVMPASLHWRSWQSLPPTELRELFVHQLPRALAPLNNSRHDSLATHLHRVVPAVEKLGTLRPQSLHGLISWLADQPFETPSDRRALLEIFDSILDKLTGKYSASFPTPAAVTRLLIEAAAPKAGDRVYDPCFGYAGLLTAACDYVIHNGKDRFGRGSAPAVTILGVEYGPHSYVIGLARLALVGVDDPHLELGNSLERISPSNPQRDGFDVVLVNPPWGMRADPVGLDHYPVRTNDVTGLFIQHALSQLRTGGRAAIVVPKESCSGRNSNTCGECYWINTQYKPWLRYPTPLSLPIRGWPPASY